MVFKSFSPATPLKKVKVTLSSGFSDADAVAVADAEPLAGALPLDAAGGRVASVVVAA
ncbi:hypothetical protein [Cohnella ginsengisoli]|uniref:hypothetical protein n=1 Tax=Cohnella ginsengisoli TaxID=425004 RepID=UPI003B8A6531